MNTSEMFHDLDFLCRQLESRLRAGERKVVEKILEENSDLRENEAAALELIYREFSVLTALGEHVGESELFARFPHLQDDLQKLMEVHHALDGELEEEDAEEENPVGSLIGRYKILEEIGEGGFGVVYMAEQLVPIRRKVAIKIIKPGMDTRSAIARFEAERQALALMEHTSICRVLDAGSTKQGRPFFVMELVRGISITEYCCEKKLPLDERLQLFQQVCNALQHAHSRNIVHRDIKPSNVMVTLYDGKPIAKIIDFGISKALNLQLTDKTLFSRYGQMIGTPMYMSPEQARLSGQDVDVRSDVYSLGILLYEILTGTPPFDEARMKSASLLDVVKIVTEEEPPTPSSRVSMPEADTQESYGTQLSPARLSQVLKGDLDQIVMKAVEKDRSRRYTSVSELAADIDRYHQHEPVLARPASLGYRVQKYIRRNRILVLTVSTLVAGLSIGLCFAVAGMLHAQHQQQLAEDAQSKERIERKRAERQEQVAQAARLAEQEQRVQVENNLYFQKIARAHNELLSGRLGRAREILLDCEPSRRDWEWHYLYRKCNSHLAVFEGHEASPTGVQLSPDGRLLATCSAIWNDPAPGRIILWDARTAKQVLSFGKASGGYRDVAFHPNGTVLGSVSPKIGFKLWDVQTGAVLFKDEQQRSFSLAFSPNGGQIAVGGSSGDLLVYSPDDGTVQHRLSHAGQAIHGVAYSPDGKLIAGLNHHGELRIWDASGGKLLTRETQCGNRAIAFSPDGTLLVTGGYAGLHAGKINVFRVSEGASLTRIAEHHTNFGAVGRLKFSPDGRSIAISGSSNALRLFDPMKGLLQHHLVAHDASVTSSCFANEGRSIYTSSSDGLIKHSLLETSSFVGNNLGFITALDISRDDKTLILAGGYNKGLPSAGEKEVQIWSLGERAHERNFSHSLVGFDQWMTDLAFGPKDKAVIAAGRNGGVCCWNVETGALNWLVEETEEQVNCLAVNEQGLIATADAGGWLRIYDRSGQVLHKWQVQSVVNDLCFHSPTNSIILGDEAGQIRILSSDGKHVLLKAVISGGASIQRLAISKDATLLASGDSAGNIQLWSLPASLEDSVDKVRLVRLSTLRGHASAITDLGFHPSGKRLVSVSNPSTAIVWSTESAHDAIRLTPHGMNDHLLAAAFSPSGDKLVAARAFEVTVLDGASLSSTTTSNSQVIPPDIDWHKRMMRHCREEEHWYGAVIHYNKLVERFPLEREYVAGRSGAYARLEKWQLALADARTALELENATLPEYLHLARLQLRVGDIPGYQQTCRDWLEISGKGFHDEATANRFGWMCAIGPGANADYEDLIAKVAAAADRSKGERRYGYLNTLGALHYRNGQFAKSKEALEEGLSHTDNPDTPYDWLLLALANRAMGNHSDAADWYRKVEEKLSDWFEEPGRSRHRWTERLELYVLLQEFGPE